MASKIKLKNDIDSEFSIEHKDSLGAVSVNSEQLKDTSYTVATVAKMELLDVADGQSCIVTDLSRGGVFVFDGAKVSEDNQGTNFSGWIRQYSGAVNVKWFGVVGDGETDDTEFIQAALDSVDVVNIPDNTTIILTESITLNEGNMILGVSNKTSKIRFKDYDASSYVNFFVLNTNTKLENFKLEVDVPSEAVGALVFLFPSKDVFNVELNNLDVDAGLIDTAGELNSTVHLIALPAFGSASNVTIKNNYFTRFKFGILQTNTSTFGSYFWTIDNNTYENFYSPALTINCPSGDADNFKITNNFLNNNLGYITGDYKHMGGVAGSSSTNKFVFSGNILTGTGEGWHFEEGAGTVTVSNDIIKVNGTGIKILDNVVGGISHTPSKFIITNNQIMNTSGGPADRGIELVYDGSGKPPLADSIITNNILENWDRAINLAEASEQLILRDNYIKDCTEGIRIGYNGIGIKDNTFENCSSAITVGSRGGFVEGITYKTDTAPFNITGSIEGSCTTLNPYKERFDLIDGNSNISLFPAKSSSEFYGLLTVNIFANASNRRNLAYEVSWDGETLTQTSKVISGAGAVTFSGFDVVAEELVVQFNNTTGNIIENAIFNATFNGYYTTL